MFRLKSIALSALVLGVAALPLPAAAEDAATPAGTAASNLPAITVSTVRTAEVEDRIYASGLVGPVETVLVQPQIQGQAIETVEAEVGDKVEKGQVLAKLSDTELTLQRSQLLASRAGAEAAIAQAEAQMIASKADADEAERVLARTKALREQGNVSQASFDQADAAATAARARLSVSTQALAAAKAQLVLVDAQIADLDLKLKRTSVTAPVAGEVVEKNAMVGAIASSGGPALFSIIKDGKLELMADVAEQDILKLHEGQPATLRFVGLTHPVEGKVRLVEPQVDSVTRLGRVRIEIADPEAVRSGMFADAEIVAERREAVVIPVSAAGGDADGATALRVKDGTVELVRIVTGIRDGGLIEVVSGLEPGDLVVTKAGAFVRDGDKINPIPEAGQPALAN
ncbi:efflux RND transporter periplasmic adaptor subunit [Frigidibacter sp. ROC022]|uniref:efflux RND transporter periplasmic adaptor subunit n=1 Tax=Frigidibacter sp. ROC022 TaxID=2971796 RepID=UPI00215B30B0|nr:efflux RND transporter periplasmic adaptor subunit [Frigidibacter sp. ROC022]MCR8722857.1 efflux RND transporter periplasmic adaptor subunit [Frigidibacter sp. ROC022]